MPPERDDDALMDADVDRICRALSSYGVLPRQRLATEVDAGEWPSGRFGNALAEAVRRGRVVDLGEGFYEPSESERGP